MSYKTILLHVHACPQLERRIGFAAALAKRFDAHLDGAAMSGISRFAHRDHATMQDGGKLAQAIASAAAEARAALQRFSAQCAAEGLRAFTPRLVDDDWAGGLVAQASYADLLIVGQTDPQARAFPADDELPGYVAVHCTRPVLVLPCAGQPAQPTRQALLAWDGSMEATRAVSAALPLLKKMDGLAIAIFDAGQEAAAHGEVPGADIALYLARHGIRAEVLPPQTGSGDVGAGLLALAASVQAELLVMGCYGHSRFREFVLGGVSRTVLERMHLPVLMAH